MYTDTLGFIPFESSQMTGVIIVSVFALLSTLALSFIAIRTICFVAVPYFKGRAQAFQAKESLFFQTCLGHYAFCLILSNVFISAGGLIDFQWISDSGISKGPLCSAQAAFMQIGNFATSYFTVAVALHTCNCLVFRIRHRRWLGPTVICTGWIISLTAGLAPLSTSNSSMPYYGPQGIACGIGKAYPILIFTFDVLPILAGILLSSGLYLLVFLVLRGLLYNKGGLKFHFDRQGRWSSASEYEEYHQFVYGMARSMLWYPFAFFVFLLPYVVTELAMIYDDYVPFGADVFAHVFYFMLGLVNVILLYNTFRVLDPVFHGQSVKKLDTDTEKGSLDSERSQSSTGSTNAIVPRPFLLTTQEPNRAIAPPAELNRQLYQDEDANDTLQVSHDGHRSLTPPPRLLLSIANSSHLVGSNRGKGALPHILTSIGEDETSVGSNRQSTFSKRSSKRRLPPPPLQSIPNPSMNIDVEYSSNSVVSDASVRTTEEDISIYSRSSWGGSTHVKPLPAIPDDVTESDHPHSYTKRLNRQRSTDSRGTARSSIWSQESGLEPPPSGEAQQAWAALVSGNAPASETVVVGGSTFGLMRSTTFGESRTTVPEALRIATTGKRTTKRFADNLPAFHAPSVNMQTPFSRAR